jgi:Fe-Mn family superoxide dismutase
MSSRKVNPEDFRSTILDSIRSTFDSNGLKRVNKSEQSEKPLSKTIKEAKTLIGKLQEAIVTSPRNFFLKTERLSKGTKEAHFNLYRKYVETFNKVSIALDSAIKQNANSNYSEFRSLKMDETYNLNGIKLHELYWANISDLQSEISIDSMPYMKFSRSWGTFEKWQFDFIATAMSSRNGWAMTVYEPYKNVYMNIVVDGHSNSIPVGVVPVVVMDMWEHAYFKDYGDDKKAYLISMMKELNWDVIEARMQIAEESKLETIYKLMPIVNDNPERLISNAERGEELPVSNITAVQGTVNASTPSPAEPPKSGE